MATIEKVTFKYARKFNLGDFNSLTLDIMPTVILEPGDDPDRVMRDAWEMCRKNIEHAARPIVNSGSGVTQKLLFLGLPVEQKETDHAD